MLGRVQMTELLLEKGANPDQVDYYGRTPVHFARICRKQRVGLILARWQGNKQRER